jgi:hypothetical protein
MAEGGSDQIGNGLLDGHFSAAGSEAVRVAIASGHGIGKSALVAWIILWAMSTLRDTRGSANTEGQLRTKTWPELAKWHAMSRNKAWFTYTATALHSAEPGRDKTWRSTPSPGRSRTPRPSPACITRAAAPSPF